MTNLSKEYLDDFVLNLDYLVNNGYLVSYNITKVDEEDNTINVSVRTVKPVDCININFTISPSTC